MVATGQRLSDREVQADGRQRRGAAGGRWWSARCHHGLPRPPHPHRPRLGRSRRVRDAASTLGCSPAQIALAWTLHQPAVVTTLIGATSPEQLHANLDAATLTLPTVILQALDSASRLLAGSPYRLFSAAR